MKHNTNQNHKHNLKDTIKRSLNRHDHKGNTHNVMVQAFKRAMV